MKHGDVEAHTSLRPAVCLVCGRMVVIEPGRPIAYPNGSPRYCAGDHDTIGPYRVRSLLTEPAA